MSNEEVIRRHTAAILQLIPVIQRHSNLLEAQLPQFFTTRELASRYATTPRGVIRLLRRHNLIPPQTRGRKDIRIPLEKVIQLDKIIKGGFYDDGDDGETDGRL